MPGPSLSVPEEGPGGKEARKWEDGGGKGDRAVSGSWEIPGSPSVQKFKKSKRIRQGLQNFHMVGSLGRRWAPDGNLRRSASLARTFGPAHERGLVISVRPELRPS